MKIKQLLEGLDSQQRSVPELPAMFRPAKISVLKNKTDPRHPMTGYAVGASESADVAKKRLGPDRNDPWEQGWRATPGYDFNPYEPGTREYAQWEDGQAERQAQPGHYDESVAEGRAGVDDTDTVGFSVNSEKAYTAVMDRYGDYIDHDETSGIMYIPAKMWPNVEMVAFDADGEGATQDDGYEHPDSPEYEVAEASEQYYAIVHKVTKKTLSTHRDIESAKDEWRGLDQDQRPFYAVMATKKKPEDWSISEAERNEMDTPAVQAALRKMAERHKGEKWTKEQLAALGKRIAARGQKSVKEDDVEDFLARGGKITQIKPNRGPRYPGTSLGSKHIGTLRGGRASSISGKSANTRPTIKPVVAVESITKEDIISKLKARLGDYLSDISKEIKKDPDLVDKLSAKAPGDQMGPPVKTVTTDDGHEIQIHGNEDDGFRVSIKNRSSNTKFKNLDEAVMACEMYCARRRNGQADYLDEA